MSRSEEEISIVAKAYKKAVLYPEVLDALKERLHKDYDHMELDEDDIRVLHALKTSTIFAPKMYELILMVNEPIDNCDSFEERFKLATKRKQEQLDSINKRAKTGFILANNMITQSYHFIEYVHDNLDTVISTVRDAVVKYYVVDSLKKAGIDSKMSSKISLQKLLDDCKENDIQVDLSIYKNLNLQELMTYYNRYWYKYGDDDGVHPTVGLFFDQYRPKWEMEEHEKMLLSNRSC
jgi:hypothetical protein